MTTMKPMSDEEIISIRKLSTSDPSRQWGDTLAFARAIIAARDAQHAALNSAGAEALSLAIMELAEEYADAWAEVKAWTDAEDVECPSADSQRNALKNFTSDAIASIARDAQYEAERPATLRLTERLRESADEVESFPHPSHCDHLHESFAVMREAANALESAHEANRLLLAARASQPPAGEAASDLLRVAELVVDWLDEEPGAHKLCDTARAAIAKHKGAIRGQPPAEPEAMAVLRELVKLVDGNEALLSAVANDGSYVGWTRAMNTLLKRIRRIALVDAQPSGEAE